MKKARILTSIILVMSIVLSLAATAMALGTDSQARADDAVMVKLEKTQGEVSLFDKQKKELTVKKDRLLYDGYNVKTQKKSYAWLNLDKDRLIKLDAISDAVVEQDNKKLDVVLKEGKLLFNVAKPLDDDESLNISTSNVVIAIRGTAGWVEFEKGGDAKVSILEGTVKVTVTDPRTGQTKTQEVTSGQTVNCKTYDSSKKGDKCDIIAKDFQKNDIPGFVLVDIAADEAFAQAIYNKSDRKVDLRDVTETQASERLAKDEGQAASNNNVETKQSVSQAPSNSTGSVQTSAPVINPTPAASGPQLVGPDGKAIPASIAPASDAVWESAKNSLGLSDTQQILNIYDITPTVPITEPVTISFESIPKSV